jgi:hypothetical protein
MLAHIHPASASGGFRDGFHHLQALKSHFGTGDTAAGGSSILFCVWLNPVSEVGIVVGKCLKKAVRVSGFES